MIFGGVEAIAALPVFPSFALSLLGSIIVLRSEKINSWRTSIGFMVLGALTVYFDFFDNPILDLAMSLACLMIRRPYEGTGKFKDLAMIACKASIFWFIGYGGLWATKWMIASVFLGEGVFSDAASAAMLRVGGDDNIQAGVLPIESLMRNWNYMGGLRWLVVLVVICLAVVAIRALIKCWQRKERKCFSPALALSGTLFAIALMPYAWIAVLSNHSFVHYFFTYRDQIVALFCLLVCVEVLWNPKLISCRQAESESA